mgnify:CR=1 FL=1
MSEEGKDLCNNLSEKLFRGISMSYPAQNHYIHKKTFSEELYHYGCRIIADRFIYLRPYCDSLECI